MVYNWIKNTQRIVCPPRCVLCDDAGADDLDLCAGCRPDLPWLVHACARCAAPLPETAPADCPDCRHRPPPFDEAAAALRYEAPADWLITRLKFHRHMSHARVLGALLAARVADASRPDVLLPVPLHPARRRERGFNQAVEIAVTTGRRIGVRPAPRLAARKRATARQADLPARKRRRNMRGAFLVDGDAAGLDIAIVDDVATTGHTAAELARTLRRAGAARVRLWTAARA